MFQIDRDGPFIAIDCIEVERCVFGIWLPDSFLSGLSPEAGIILMDTLIMVHLGSSEFSNAKGDKCITYAAFRMLNLYNVGPIIG